ncbi:MAG: HAD-IIA family hydrolase [Planctomycetota bacterium]
MGAAPESTAPRITMRELLDRYDALFLDAYGVLVAERGAIAGAAELLTYLDRAQRNFLILTNDASRTPAETAAHFRELGLAVATERILTSGELLKHYFATHDLIGGRCIVLGAERAKNFVRGLGVELVAASAEADPHAVIICGTRGYDLLDEVEETLSAIYRSFDAGRAVHLVCPNPDIVYPKGHEAYGLAAGAVAHLIESGLDARYPHAGRRFVRLGKPHAPIFEAALARTQARRPVMIGDTLATDIAGALACGIDATLVSTGISRASQVGGASARPTWILDSLAI